MNCRHCDAALEHVFLDLGRAPPSNAYLDTDALNVPERVLPLRLLVCTKCWLVQTEDYASAGDLFDEKYAYFSSTSSTWLDHATEYAEMICKRLGLDASSFVLEIAANDGYLLKNFLKARIPCLGVEPTASTASAAEALGIPIVREFFGANVGKRLASTYGRADLVVANNVLAHVPDVNDFVSGVAAVLNVGGTATLEFPHLLRLIDGVQFDTVYHEHFSYFSLYSAQRVLSRASLRVFDLEELSTHGGSLRLFVCHDNDPRASSQAVNAVIAAEDRMGLRSLAGYSGFQMRADEICNQLCDFLNHAKRSGLKVAAYGAAAKGNTLLNYAKINSDLLAYVCDAAPSKQGRFLPGSHIPIVAPHTLESRKPDLVLILPWNIAGEVMSQHSYISTWGGRFAVAVPKVQLIS